MCGRVVLEYPAGLVQFKALGVRPPLHRGENAASDSTSVLTLQMKNICDSKLVRLLVQSCGKPFIAARGTRQFLVDEYKALTGHDLGDTLSVAGSFPRTVPIKLPCP